MRITHVYSLVILGLLCGCITKQNPPEAPLIIQSEQPVRAPEPGQPDPIGALVARLASTHGPYGLMNDGLWTIFDASSFASASQVVEQVFEKTDPDKRIVTDHRILEIRKVWIDSNYPSDSYIAVRVKTNLGHKIVLVRWSSNQQQWWGRFYDEERSA
jgi:hypothetical protein